MAPPMTAPGAEHRPTTAEERDSLMDGLEQVINEGHSRGTRNTPVSVFFLVQLRLRLSTAKRACASSEADLARAEAELRDSAANMLSLSASLGKKIERVTELEAQAERYRAALKPFADYALVSDLGSGHNAPDDGEVLVATSQSVKKTLYVGTFREARSALEEAPGA